MNTPPLKLISIEGWIDQTFMGINPPSSNTVRRWCRQGFLESERIGRRWYIASGTRYRIPMTKEEQIVSEMIASISSKF